MPKRTVNVPSVGAVVTIPPAVPAVPVILPTSSDTAGVLGAGVVTGGDGVGAGTVDT